MLLDTHVVLWALSRPERLGEHHDLIIGAPTRLLSAVVVWEVAIKAALGRLDVGSSIPTWARLARRDLAADSTSITEEHAALVADLPHLHRDPFDRLLIAQSIALDVPLLTADPQLIRYDADVVLVTG